MIINIKRSGGLPPAYEVTKGLGFFIKPRGCRKSLLILLLRRGGIGGYQSLDPDLFSFRAER